MRYDETLGAFVVTDDVVFPTAFVINEHLELPLDSGTLVQETRVTRGYFENRWGVSIIWGSMTYSDNYDHPHGFRRGGHRPVFVEEPHRVEVGIVMPEPIIVPAETIGPPEHRLELPGRKIELWGEPLGYVDAEALAMLLRAVSHFPSHDYNPRPADVRIEVVDGTPTLVVEQEEPCDEHSESSASPSPERSSSASSDQCS